MEKLDLIINDLKESLKINKIEVTGNCLFENAVKIYISDKIENKKTFSPFNNKFKNTELDNEKAPSKSITESQKKYLDSKKIDTDGMTKQEAYIMIKELKSKEVVNGNKNKWVKKS